jgi:hypothetical protein
MEPRIVQEAERNAKLYGYQAKSWHDRNSIKHSKRGSLETLAIYRPFWNTGGEMGNWDEELM